MAYEITSGKIPSALKVVVYGPEGIGKTTIASKFPAPVVFIDTEGGTKHMDVARLPSPKSWTALIDTVKHVAQNPNGIATLAIDTADWAERLCIEDVCAKAKNGGLEDFGYGKGYTYLQEAFGKLLDLLTQVVERGVHVVVAAHAQMRKFEEPNEMGAYDRWELKLTKKCAPMVREWADMVLFANYKVTVVNVDNQGAAKGKNKAQGGQRVMYATHNPCWDAKNRHGLPDEMPFEFSQIAHVFGGAGMGTTPHQSNPSASTASPQGEAVENGASTQAPVTPTQTTAPPENGGRPKAAPTGGGEASTQTPAFSSPPPDDWDGIPPALADLMKRDKVTPQEIRNVVAKKGYYPASTPIGKYDPDFIKGVLIGAWGQVFNMIDQLKQGTPF